MISVLRTNFRPVAAIAVSVVLALLVGGYILVNQRVALPGDPTYVVRGEFASARAVVGGQGQQVTVAGVPVGEISGVERTDRSTAVVSMRIKRDKLSDVYRDATMVLRPRTGLQDMTIALRPGRRNAGVLPRSGTVPIAQTTPQVQIDEVLSILDSDSRAYVRQFLAATDRGLGNSTERVQRLLALAAPTARKTSEVLEVINDRRALVKNGISRLGRISTALAGRDRDLVALLDNAATTFKTVGAQDDQVAAAIAELLSTLTAARTTVGRTAELATEVQAAAKPLTPALRATTEALPRLDPLVRDLDRTVVPVQRLARTGAPALERLGSVVSTTGRLSPDLRATGVNARYLLNVLAHNPAGKDEGYLFWLAWFMHNGNSTISTQDAAGAAWRSQAIFSCSSLAGADALKPLTDLLATAGGC